MARRAHSDGIAPLASLRAVDGLPTTKYAKNGDVHLAYQVLGNGPLDLVVPIRRASVWRGA